MKKLIALLVAVIMVVSMIPVMAISTSADNGEQATPATGDWDVYRSASSYPSEDDDEDTVYPPTAGYAYTDDGFSVIGADYANTTPFMTVQTTDKVNLKDGFYVQWRIDDYSYDGGTGADQWITPSFTTEQMVEPGSAAYGGGWLALIRGAGNGVANSYEPHITDPKTDEFGGSFNGVGSTMTSAENPLNVPMDESGREIYTLQVTYDNGYKFVLNGVELLGSAQATALLDKLDAHGEFYFGVTLMSKVQGGTAACTILKVGTSEEDATTPTNSDGDTREPEENEMTIADIADPSTVEANTPAILWDPTTRTMKYGNNINFTVQGDNTWKATATSKLAFWQFTPRRAWSYDAVDFPVFGIMFRNIWIDQGTLWYAAGEVMSAQNDCTTHFSIYDGEFFGEDEEYVFVPVDMTDLWEGRINAVRLDFDMGEDQSNWEFEICFAGMFRSVDEGYAYAQTWLANNTDVDTGIETDAPTNPPEDDTDAPTDATTTAPDNAGDDATDEGGNDDAAATGCASVVGMGAVAILAAAAAAVALKKKD